MDIQYELTTLTDRERVLTDVRPDLEDVKKYARYKLNSEVNRLGSDTWVVRPTGDSRQSATVFMSYASMRAWINQQATRRQA